MGARACGLENRDDFVTAGFGQVMREKSAIANDDAKCHFSLRCHFLAPLISTASRYLTKHYSIVAVVAVADRRTGFDLRASGTKLDDVKKTEQRQQAAPPDRGMQIGQLHAGG